MPGFPFWKCHQAVNKFKISRSSIPDHCPSLLTCSANNVIRSGKSSSSLRVSVLPLSSRENSTVFWFSITTLLTTLNSNFDKWSRQNASFTLSSERVMIHFNTSSLVRLVNLWPSKYGYFNGTAQTKARPLDLWRHSFVHRHYTSFNNKFISFSSPFGCSCINHTQFTYHMLL